MTLPISSAQGVYTSFLDCLFTATSASCVTGLVVKDTATYWSTFGKVIILIMIQIGGLGVVTMTYALVKLSGRKISLFQRSLVQESVSAEHSGGISNYINFILKTTLLFEGVGALLLSLYFCNEFGLLKGICYGIWHSISAFCNAGFDLMGNFTSLTRYLGNAYINVVIMLLIICGGLSFATWADVKKHGIHLRRYTLQSKIIISSSILLIVIPSIFFYFYEFKDLPTKERLLASIFQSVTTRTAGFNTTDQSKLSDSGSLVSMILMMIGGSPGSTAGGLKTTTISVLIISSFSVFMQTDNAHAYKRRIDDSTIKAASAIFLLYVSIFILAAIIICEIESLPLIKCLYEIASAIGTVGLTTGITPLFHGATKIILIVLMFFGRVGCLTLIYALLPRIKETAKLPMEHVNVG